MSLNATLWHIFVEHQIGVLAMGRGEFRTAATSKMECFVIIVNGWKSLTILTKHSILDFAAVLDPPLDSSCKTLVL